MGGKLDPNIRPFFSLLHTRRQDHEEPLTLDLYWRNNGDRKITCLLSGAGLPLVEVDAAILEARGGVDDGLVRQNLSDNYLSLYEHHVERVSTDKRVKLGVLATAVFGPLTSPLRKAQNYNPFQEFRLRRDDVVHLLGADWAAALTDGKRERDLFTIRDAAAAAAQVGLLEGVVPADAADGEDEEDLEEEESEAEGGDESADSSATEWDGARNEIYFGPPGTGKSYGIEQRLRQFGVTDATLFRVTFHPEVAYSDFVGAFRPRVVWVAEQTALAARPPAGEKGEPRTYYDFVPGPFSEALAHAAKTDEWTALVVEELNRGNCAAIFGDVFQLLDRRTTEEDDWPVGWSVYGITPSPEWAEWLSAHIPEKSRVFDRERGLLRLPPKLLLLASMNTSDQNLFPLDTAFRRRWSMRYIGIDATTDPGYSVLVTNRAGSEVSWAQFFRAMNERIVSHTRSDDKQMGPWFVRPRVGKIISAADFRSKVLYYLWSDVFPDRPQEVFRDHIRTYDALVAAYDDGRDVFQPDVLRAVGFHASGEAESSPPPAPDPER